MEENMKSEAYPSEEVKDKVMWSEIEKADNGWVVEYTIKKKTEMNKTFGESYPDKHKELFSTEEEDKAWDRFKALKIREFECKKEH